MKKLTLDLDTLRVESFEPSPVQRREGGTVHAHAVVNDSQNVNCWKLPPNDPTFGATCFTCEYSCYGTCDYSCEGTCGQGTCYGDSCTVWTGPSYC